MPCGSGKKGRYKKMATGGSVESRVAKLEAHEKAEGKLHNKLKGGGSVGGQPGNSNGVRQRKNLAMGK